MSCYLDANVLVALLVPEPLSARADAFLTSNLDVYLVSDLAAAEFASAVSRRVRMSEMSLADGRLVLSGFDGWAARSTRRIEVTAADIDCADGILRRLDLPLVTPDAIHIAMTQRIGATLVTFDRQMAASARALGAAVATP